MCLKVVGTRRVPSIRSIFALNSATTNGVFNKSSGTRRLLLCQKIMHTPQSPAHSIYVTSQNCATINLIRQALIRIIYYHLF